MLELQRTKNSLLYDLPKSSIKDLSLLIRKNSHFTLFAESLSGLPSPTTNKSPGLIDSLLIISNKTDVLSLGYPKISQKKPSQFRCFTISFNEVSGVVEFRYRLYLLLNASKTS